MTKKTNLQPWLDYFSMLMKCEEDGFLLIKTEDHEAYITQPCLHAITPGDDPLQQGKAIIETAHRILTFAAWKSQEGKDYLRHNFAVNVVQPDEPHDPLYTIHTTYCNKFWRRWFGGDLVTQIIDYTDVPKFGEPTSTQQLDNNL